MFLPHHNNKTFPYTTNDFLFFFFFSFKTNNLMTSFTPFRYAFSLVATDSTNQPTNTYHGPLCVELCQGLTEENMVSVPQEQFKIKLSFKSALPKTFCWPSFSSWSAKKCLLNIAVCLGYGGWMSQTSPVSHIAYLPVGERVSEQVDKYCKFGNGRCYQSLDKGQVYRVGGAGGERKSFWTCGMIDLSKKLR